MRYKCLPNQKFESQNNYTLVPLREEDLESIRKWRNEQIDVLRQYVPLTPEDQENYYRSVIEPSFGQDYPRQILFSFLHNGICIGYGGLVHINWESSRAEISFLLDPEQAPHYFTHFTEFLTLVHRVSFESLNLHRIFAETYAFRTGHIAILENMGFILEGHLREHVYKDEKWIDSLLHGLLAQDPFHAV